MWGTEYTVSPSQFGDQLVLNQQQGRIFPDQHYGTKAMVAIDDINDKVLNVFNFLSSYTKHGEQIGSVKSISLQIGFR